jgi:hypothetical protein
MVKDALGTLSVLKAAFIRSPEVDRHPSALVRADPVVERGALLVVECYHPCPG